MELLTAGGSCLQPPPGALLERTHAYFMEEYPARRMGGEELPGGVWRPLAG